MSKNIRTYSEVEFRPGDVVCYKRRMTKGWKGPAKVLGKEGNFVLIRHGSAYYRCHPCHLIKENPETGNAINEDKEEKRATPVIKKDRSTPVTMTRGKQIL